MQFVNIHGSPISVMPTKGKKKPAAKREARHEGWVAMGISPEMIQDAKDRAGSKFELEQYLRTTLPIKIRKKPFFSASAAADAVEVAHKCGWKACKVVEKVYD